MTALGAPSSGMWETEKSPLLPKRHPTFYFEDALVTIQIENTLFNVHKYQLIDSETFSDMFSMPRSKEREPVEGSSEEIPIIIHGVSASDFEALLTVLYARRFSTQQSIPEASLIVSAFRLANMWNFSDLRTHLLLLAEKVLSDVDKIVFAREFDITDWLALPHVNLCRRPQPPTIEEARKLGFESILMISRMREEFPSSGRAEQLTDCSGAARNIDGGAVTPPDFGQPAFGQSAFGQSAFGQPAFGQLAFGRPSPQRNEHCAGCVHGSSSSRPSPETVVQMIKEKINEWVENNCALTE